MGNTGSGSFGNWAESHAPNSLCSWYLSSVWVPPNLLTLHSARGPKGSHKFCVSGQIDGEELRVMQAGEAPRGHSAESGYET